MEVYSPATLSSPERVYRSNVTITCPEGTRFPGGGNHAFAVCTQSGWQATESSITCKGKVCHSVLMKRDNYTLTSPLKLEMGKTRSGKHNSQTNNTHARTRSHARMHARTRTYTRRFKNKNKNHSSQSKLYFISKVILDTILH